MRLEVRKSGGPECVTCGSFELVKILDSVGAARDISLLVEAEWEQREAEIRAAYEGKLEARDERIQEALPAAVERSKPRGIRFLKRRWQERLEQEIEAEVRELLAQTRL